MNVTIIPNCNVKWDAASSEGEHRGKNVQEVRIGYQNPPNVTNSFTDLWLWASRWRKDFALLRNRVLLQSRSSSGVDPSGNGGFAGPDSSLRGAAARRGVLQLGFGRLTPQQKPVCQACAVNAGRVGPGDVVDA